MRPRPLPRPAALLATSGPVLGLVLGLLALCPGAGRAQEAPEKMPGYVDLAALGAFSEEEVNVEIHLTQPLLQFVAETFKQEDSEFSALLAGLKLVRVRVLSLADHPERRAEVMARMEATARRLKGEGWQAVVQVREEGERVHVFLKMKEKTIQGLVVMFGQPEEVGFVNIVGHLDPAQLGRVARSLDIEPLQHLPGAGATPPAPGKEP